MKTSVETLQEWFENQPSKDQRDVLDFLYGGKGKVLMQEGLYVGPSPNVVYKGLHCGPVPASSSNVCPSCGKPL